MGQMLMEGLDVYTPLVDDHGVDCVIKRASGELAESSWRFRSRRDREMLFLVMLLSSPHFSTAHLNHSLTTLTTILYSMPSACL